MEKSEVQKQFDSRTGNSVLMQRIYNADATTSVCVGYYDKDVKFSQYTIELPWRENQKGISCIPEGVYNVTRHKSPIFGDCFLVNNVEGRSEILFHSLNFVYGSKVESKGCIGPALSLGDINKDGHLDGQSSKDALKVLIKYFPKGFTLYIKS